MLFGVMTVLVLAVAAPALANGNGRGGERQPVVYVESQDLFYDSVVVTDVPNKGSFQLLEMGGASGLMTEFGPGDVGYLGGRWKFDSNGDGTIDKYFICPLLGPGYEGP